MIFRNRIYITALILSASCFGTKAGAQSSYEAMLEKADSQHQECLDNSDDPAACSDRYYKTVDSMLTIVYRSVLKELAPPEKTALRNDQRNWLAARAAKFKAIEGAAKKEDEGNMDRSSIMEDKAAHIRERVDELMGKIK